MSIAVLFPFSSFTINPSSTMEAVPSNAGNNLTANAEFPMREVINLPKIAIEGGTET